MDKRPEYCPDCDARTQFQINSIDFRIDAMGMVAKRSIPNHYMSNCSICGFLKFFGPYGPNRTMIEFFPAHSDAPQPNKDMPEAIQQTYVEAAAIYKVSPRGAAALLRLAFQQLTVALGLPGKHLNEDIGTLVRERGLPNPIRDACDTLRVIGNEAVHPGTIDLNDNIDLVEAMFVLLNQVAYDQLSKPRELEELKARLPQGPFAQADKRDNR